MSNGVERQYIGNAGKKENGIVVVMAEWLPVSSSAWVELTTRLFI